MDVLSQLHRSSKTAARKLDCLPSRRECVAIMWKPIVVKFFKEEAMHGQLDVQIYDASASWTDKAEKPLATR
jgi:hypothetical protein